MLAVSDGCYEGVNHVAEIMRQENGDAACNRDSGAASLSKYF